MEYNTLPLKKNVQRKFSEWFGDPAFTTDTANPSIGYPISVDLSLPTAANYSMEDPIPVDLSLPTLVNYPIGNTTPVNLPFPATANDLHSKTPKLFSDNLKTLMVVVLGSFLRAETAYVSIGLFLVISTIGFFTTGMPNSLRGGTPLSTPVTPSALTENISTPTSTSMAMLLEPTSTATIRNMAPSAALLIPSPTPIPSDTLIGLLKIGYLSQVGPLSLTDQLRVYESSLKYVGISPDEIQLIGEEINGPGYGSPDNICGPLSLAILQEAGIVRPDINPHAFWLLNPDVKEKRELLSMVFPPDRFENTRFRIPLKNMDWHTNPLYPGDFLYIYAGTGGTFEHMLVVDRVDSAGRAYSINNYMTPNGFIITEVLLYDPADPSVGMFPAWTARPNSKSGSTGFAGFEVWRLKMP